MLTMASSDESDTNECKQKIISKRPFTLHEDQLLIRYIMLNGPNNWSMLASMMTNRTPKQCRERWHNHLNPNINKGPWTYAEDLILAQKQHELGNRWADIARFLPGRTDTLVKNRWNTSVKARSTELLFKNSACSQQPAQDQFSNWLSSLSAPKKFDNSFLTIPPLLQRPTSQVF